MEKDLQPQPIKGTKGKGPPKSDGSNFDKPAECFKKKPKNVKKTPKKNKNNKKNSSTNNIGCDEFVYDEIANNKEASDLIADLVKCYTCNSTLPKDEVELLNKSLQEKTIFVILNILNNCVDKIFNKLIKSEVFKDFLNKKPVETKNAFCQTKSSFDLS